MSEELCDIFLKFTILPKDIINVIIDFTYCDCKQKKKNNLMTIKQVKCNYCNNFTSTSNNFMKLECNNCNNTFINDRYYFRNRLRRNGKIKKGRCQICHSCLVRKKRVRKCYDCEVTIVKFY